MFSAEICMLFLLSPFGCDPYSLGGRRSNQFDVFNLSSHCGPPFLHIPFLFWGLFLLLYFGIYALDPASIWNWAGSSTLWIHLSNRMIVGTMGNPQGPPSSVSVGDDPSRVSFLSFAWVSWWAARTHRWRHWAYTPHFDSFSSEIGWPTVPNFIEANRLRTGPPHLTPCSPAHPPFYSPCHLKSRCRLFSRPNYWATIRDNYADVSFDSDLAKIAPKSTLDLGCTITNQSKMFLLDNYDSNHNKNRITYSWPKFSPSVTSLEKLSGNRF